MNGVFSFRPAKAEGHLARALDHLSEGERAALVQGRLDALQNRRLLRWN